jgi:hypothetical protein
MMSCYKLEIGRMRIGAAPGPEAKGC